MLVEYVLLALGSDVGDALYCFGPSSGELLSGDLSLRLPEAALLPPFSKAAGCLWTQKSVLT